jgi:nucleoside-diphosphate-sugar epimerase
MRVFVAGASGAIGRRLVPRLVAAGHDVTGMTRSEAGAGAIRAAGARAAVVDVFDRDALDTAVAEAAPEVLVHQLTALPRRFEPRRRELYDATNRVRTEGTRNLVVATRACGTSRIVCQSVAFAYAPEGPRVKSEEAPLHDHAPPPFGAAVRALAEMEQMVLEPGAPEGVVLRYGWFYGPGTYFGEGGHTESEVRRRRFPVVGEGGGLFSFVHVDDAAEATVRALDHGRPGVYNVVDDEPGAMRDWLPAYARAIGASPPRRVPGWLARLLAGRMTADMSVSLPGASNARARHELGWEPRWPSWRKGFAEAPR